MLIINLSFLYIILGLLQINFCKNVKISFLLTIITFISYVFVTGLRWKTGTDWFPYEEAFSLISKNKLSKLDQFFEVGYMYFFSCISFFSQKFSIALIVQSTIIAIFLNRVAARLKIPFTLFIALEFLLQSQFYYPVRQQLSVVISMYGIVSYIFSVDKNKIKFILIMFVAASIHLSALIGLFMVIKLKQKRIFFTFLLIGLAFFFMYVGADFLFHDFLWDRINKYIIENNLEFDPLRSYLRIIERIISVSLIIYLLRSDAKLVFTDEQKSFLCNAIILGLCISLSVLYFPYLIRFSAYFSWIEAVVVSSMLLIFNSYNKKIKVILIFLCMMYSIKFLVSLLPYWDLINPYFFVFENVSRSIY